MQKKIIYVICIILMIFSGGCRSVYKDVLIATGSDGYLEDTELYDFTVSVEGDEDLDSSGFDFEAETSELIPVYVCGAVASPGVYYISADSIKQDALAAAGGFAEDACEDYVNLAEAVYSGEKIYFPYEDELGENYSPIALDGGIKDNGALNQGKVNINRATVDILMTLPGIGASKAQAIIDYREEFGPFSHIEDIKNVNGIKDNIYDNIKDNIVVN